MGLFGKKSNTSAISKVRLLGVRTAQETMIFTTVNFSVYSFWVEYENGTTETIELSPGNPNDKSGKEKNLFNKMMALANADMVEQPSNASTESSANAIDELKKVKDLLDAGVLPQSLYEERRDALLRTLSKESKNVELAQKENTENVTIIRANKRPAGEVKTTAYIDGEKLKNEIDNSISLYLSDGEHTIRFQRAAVKSSEVKIVVSENKKYCISFAPKAFSIEVSVQEK